VVEIPSEEKTLRAKNASLLVLFVEFFADFFSPLTIPSTVSPGNPHPTWLSKICGNRVASLPLYIF
jgi:hypothetical protein